MSQRTRRQFLADSMIAAAAAASGVSPPLREAAARSDHRRSRLGVAIIGVRGRGASHIAALAGRKDTEVLYLCEVDAAVGAMRAAEVAKRQGRSPGVVLDLHAALADPRVDLVTIATPNHGHAAQALAALEQGKHVYLESPLGHTVEAGRSIVAAAAASDRLVQCGLQARSNPGMLQAIDFLRSGAIGFVRSAVAICYKRRGPIGAAGQYAPPEEVDWERWQGPAPHVEHLTRPRLHHDWRWQWAYGNGELGSQALTPLDLARWGLGLERWPESVLTCGGRFGKRDAGETANTLVGHYEFGEQNLTVEIRSLPSPSLRGVKVGVLFEGEHGTVVLTSYSDGAAFDRHGQLVRTFSGTGDHFENLLRAIRAGRPSLLAADAVVGQRSSDLAHLGNFSYRLGAPASVEDARQVFGHGAGGLQPGESFERTLAHLADNRVNLAGTPFQLGCQLTLDPATERVLGDPRAAQLLAAEGGAWPGDFPSLGRVDQTRTPFVP